MSSVCPKILDMMLDYERLNEDQRLLVDEHTVHCSDCREELDMVKEVGVIFDHDEVVVPDNFADCVMASVEPLPQEDSSVPVFWWLGGLAAAQIVLAVMLQASAPGLLQVAQNWFASLDFISPIEGVTGVFCRTWKLLHSFDLSAPPTGMSLATLLGWVIVVLLFAGAFIYHERSGHAE